MMHAVLLSLDLQLDYPGELPGFHLAAAALSTDYCCATIEVYLSWCSCDWLCWREVFQACRFAVSRFPA